jgi:hypothetical protein
MAQSMVAGGRQPARPRVRGLANNENLTRETTKYMIGTLEWTGLIFQAIVLFGSAIFDPYISGGRVILLCLATAHLFLMPLYYRGYGPFTRGGWWAILCIAQGMSVNTLQEVLSRPRTYGDHLSCVPGCNYSATAWLFIAFYPWLPPTLIRFRGLFEWAILAAYYGYFLALSWINNGSLTLLNVKTACWSFVWLFIAYIFGKAIGKMCLAAAQKQLEVQQRNYAEFFDFLHSHVKSSITAIRLDLPDPLRAGEKLNELEDTIGGYRMELLLALEQVPLAALFSDRIRAFTGVLDITATPRLGAVTVTRPIGVLIARALGDLLKNAALYGATAVQISCDISQGKIRLEIADNGPGFPAQVLDDSSRSLNRLRTAARGLGGDLTMNPPATGSGAILTMTAPLHGPEVGR